jgi:hypothetical protein
VRETGHIWGNKGNTYRVLVRKRGERNHLEDLGVDMRIILKRAFQKYGGMSLTRLIWLMLGISGVL